MPGQKVSLYCILWTLSSATVHAPFLCSAFCSCSVFCYVPVIFHSSLHASLLGGKVGKQEWRWIPFLIWVFSSDSWWLPLQKKKKSYSYPCHFSLFILFVGLVLTLDFECNLFVLKERRLCLNFSSKRFICSAPYLSSDFPPSLLLFIISVSIFNAFFPNRVCPFN